MTLPPELLALLADKDRLERERALSQEFNDQHAALEARWVAKHQEAQRIIDSVGPVVGSMEGLRDWLTRGLDESFEAAETALWAEFEAKRSQAP
jgi:hypothetical protein